MSPLPKKPPVAVMGMATLERCLGSEPDRPNQREAHGLRRYRWSVQNPHLSNPGVVWKSPRLFEISYDEARIHRFHNIWCHREIQDFHYAVELCLALTTHEFALPAGDRH